jgi:hypothetical protein
MATCAGKTKTGARCKKTPVQNSIYCAIHKPKTTAVPKKKRQSKVIPKNVTTTKARSLQKIKALKTKPSTEVKGDDMHELLGNEVVIFNMLLLMEPSDLHSACELNKQFAHICNTPLFKKSYIEKWGVPSLHDPLSKYTFSRTAHWQDHFVSRDRFVTISSSNKNTFDIMFDSKSGLNPDSLFLKVKGDNIVVSYFKDVVKKPISKQDVDKKFKKVDMFLKSGKVSATLKKGRVMELFKKYELDHLLHLSKERAIAFLTKIRIDAITR